MYTSLGYPFPISASTLTQHQQAQNQGAEDGTQTIACVRACVRLDVGSVLIRRDVRIEVGHHCNACCARARLIYRRCKQKEPGNILVIIPSTSVISSPTYKFFIAATVSLTKAKPQPNNNDPHRTTIPAIATAASLMHATREIWRADSAGQSIVRAKILVIKAQHISYYHIYSHTARGMCGVGSVRQSPRE